MIRSAASVPSDCLDAPIATRAPGTSILASPGSIRVTETERSTNTVCSPPLYLRTMRRDPSLPVTLATVALVIVLRGADFAAGVTLVTVAFVIVLPGSRSIGRCPSPEPRMDSENTCTSLAVIAPSGRGVAVVPM